MIDSAATTQSNEPNPILTKLQRGGRKALARAITIVENNLASKESLLKAVHSRPSHSQIIGFTGPPGVGKSTLIDTCIPKLRELNYSVAVIAVDPSSHFTGGAILGDRVRMAQHSEDDSVFIRSVAARGHLGGLSSTAQNIIKLFQAVGWDKIIVETVGAGQSEIEISEVADTVIVMEAPGLGDEVQAIKAGLLEVADIVVVNKADQSKADLTVSQLKSSIALRHHVKSPKIFKTAAISGIGISELVQEICTHHESRDKSEHTNALAARNRSHAARILGESVERKFRDSKLAALDQLTLSIQLGKVSADQLAQKMVDSLAKSDVDSAYE